jgi:hypothetical protein
VLLKFNASSFLTSSHLPLSLLQYVRLSISLSLLGPRRRRKRQGDNIDFFPVPKDSCTNPFAATANHGPASANGWFSCAKIS